MKKVTYEEFLEFVPCWLAYEDEAERIKTYFERFNGKMSALDLLNLNDVRAEDKLWEVLREEFIPASILHEFACVCAEYAISLTEYPHPHSENAIKVKRAWISGKATDEELDTAKDAAWNAAEDAVEDNREDYAAAKAAAWATDENAVSAAKGAVCEADRAAYDADRDTYEDTKKAQITYLIMALKG